MIALHARLVRSVTYPLWQWRRKGKVLPYLARLEQTQWLSQSDLDLDQLTRLRALVAHAYAHSPFYREAFSKVGVVPEAIQSLDHLRSLPVLEKTDLRDRMAEIMTVPRGPSLVQRKTSGSTGVPIELWATPEARDLWVAANLRFMHWWKIEIGDRRLTLISRHDITRLGWLKQFLFANVLEYSAMDLSRAALERVLSRLARGSVRLVMGYPSSLTYLAQHILEAGAWRPRRLQAVFTTGEMLHSDQRVLLGRVFQCPVVNEYGASETGHIAGECPYGRMHVASESVLVECQPEGEAASPRGHDLLVTDLTNFATPLIRYRIGDVGSLGDACPCGRGLPVLRLGAGRSLELVVLPDGRRVDISIFDVVLDELAHRGIHLHQWRVIQHAVDHFEVLLAGPDQLIDAAESVADRIVAALRARVRVDVKHVALIPPDPAGKRRRFVSHLVFSAARDEG